MIEKELLKRNLPNLLLMPNGKRVSSVKEWESVQKPYLKEILLREEYGKTFAPIEPKITSKLNAVDFSGKAVWEEIEFLFELGNKSHAVKTNLILPKQKSCCPVIIYINFRPDIPDRYLPVEEIIDNGFGVFSVCRGDIASDNASFDKLASVLISERDDETGGLLMVWAYMAMKMMDYLQLRSEVDKSKIGIAGHSRLGKTALLAAALDERFAFVFANNSGCSGAALSRGHCLGAEKLEHITVTFPFWFCKNYLKYIYCDDELPFDQHYLLALIAPRIVYVGGALEDTWADNDNQFLSCVSASPVWKLYNKDGLVYPNRLPLVGDEFMDGEVGFYLRAGTHYHSRTDWNICLNALKKKLKV